MPTKFRCSVKNCAGKIALLQNEFGEGFEDFYKHETLIIWSQSPFRDFTDDVN